MSEYLEKAEKLSLPLIVGDDEVIFPSEIVNFEITNDEYGSSDAAKYALAGSHFAFAASTVYTSFENDEEKENKSERSLFEVGTVIKIKQIIQAPNNAIRIIAEGYSRASLVSYRHTGEYCTAEVISKTVTMPDNSLRNEAYRREMIVGAERIAKLIPLLPKEIMSTIKGLRNPAQMADFIASNIIIRQNDKLDILRIYHPYDRIEALLAIMDSEIDVLECQQDVTKKTNERISKNQRDYFLREELRVIKEELGESDESDEFYYRIMNMPMPDEAKEKLLKENEKLAKAPYGSAESTVISNYLDICLSLPWDKKTKDRANVETARRILDDDHDGLDDVKRRLLEFLAVKQLNPELKGQIICLVGPPGVGKTSIASSLAHAMKRKYVRVSLGGVRDEADIRGHRKTYVGAMPGRIINAIIQAKSKNPLILLDEIDKMANDGRGDPASAMLEVLDPEQNKYFRDHFIEMPFDLSDCFFIATANTLETVPRPLIDRMEIIELNTYTKTEKTGIAKNHLIPKQLKAHGLNKRMLKITDDALSSLIDSYTRESGVRNLEREIGSLCRKAALAIIENNEKHIVIDSDNLSVYLGAAKILPEHISASDEIGVVNGLAYTQAGGDLLKIEVAVMDGDGKLELTGNLGDVMKESAKAALTCARQLASRYNIPSDFYKKKDIHIHVPEGATPKDGPSAGVTMLTALISALGNIPVKHDVAMTGEITLRGNVLPIGGLREKTMAAYAAGVTTVLIPSDNLKDIEKTDLLVRENITFIPCSKASDVLKYALAEDERQGKTDDSFGEIIIPAINRPQVDRANQ